MNIEGLIDAHPVLSPLAGGLLVALAGALLLLANGQLPGVAHAIAGLSDRPGDAADLVPRAALLLGLLTGGLVLRAIAPSTLAPPLRSDVVLVATGLVAGFGVRLARGGLVEHALFGAARVAPRALVASALMLASACATALVVGG